jgi:hypothetical protein
MIQNVAFTSMVKKDLVGGFTNMNTKQAYLIYKKTFTGTEFCVEAVCLDLETCKKEIERLNQIEIDFYKDHSSELCRNKKDWFYCVEANLVLS